MAFLLQRIVRCGWSFHRNADCLDLKWLFCFWSRDQGTLYDHGCTNVTFADLVKVVHVIMKNNLKGFKIRTVCQYQETESLGVTDTSYPAANLDLFIQIVFTVFVYVSYSYQIHVEISFK